MDFLFKDGDMTDFTQVTTSFAAGLLMGPFSRGIYWFISFYVFTIIVIVIIGSKLDPWQKIRLFLASLIGWVIGRNLILC